MVDVPQDSREISVRKDIESDSNLSDISDMREGVHDQVADTYAKEGLVINPLDFESRKSLIDSEPSQSKRFDMVSKGVTTEGIEDNLLRREAMIEDFAYCGHTGEFTESRVDDYLVIVIENSLNDLSDDEKVDAILSGKTVSHINDPKKKLESIKMGLIRVCGYEEPAAVEKVNQIKGIFGAEDIVIGEVAYIPYEPEYYINSLEYVNMILKKGNTLIPPPGSSEYPKESYTIKSVRFQKRIGTTDICIRLNDDREITFLNLSSLYKSGWMAEGESIDGHKVRKILEIDSIGPFETNEKTGTDWDMVFRDFASKKMTKGEKRKRLYEIKEGLALQYKVIQQLSEAIQNYLRDNIPEDYFELESRFLKPEITENISSGQCTTIRRVLYQIAERHRNVAKYARQFIKYEDKRQVVKELFGIDIKGDVELTITPYIIHLDFKDPIDYVKVYQLDSEHEAERIHRSGGRTITRCNIPELNSAVTISKNQSKDRITSVIEHEERHQVNKFLFSEFAHEKFSFDEIQMNAVKDEIIAYLIDGTSIGEIEHILTDESGIYNYFRDKGLSSEEYEKKWKYHVAKVKKLLSAATKIIRSDGSIDVELLSISPWKHWKWMVEQYSDKYRMKKAEKIYNIDLSSSGKRKKKYRRRFLRELSDYDGTDVFDRYRVGDTLRIVGVFSNWLEHTVTKKEKDKLWIKSKDSGEVDLADSTDIYWSNKIEECIKKFGKGDKIMIFDQDENPIEVIVKEKGDDSWIVEVNGEYIMVGDIEVFMVNEGMK